MGRPVDLVSRNSLHERLRDDVLAEARLLCVVSPERVATIRFRSIGAKGYSALAAAHHEGKGARGGPWFGDIPSARTQMATGA